LPLTREQRHDLILRLASGELAQRDLKEREGDCRVLRVEPEPGQTLIVKVWNRPGLRGVLRRLTSTTPFQRELTALERLHDVGVRVPAVLGAGRIRVAGFPFTHVLLLEDLGDCRFAIDHVKGLLRAGRIEAVEKFLEEVVEMTGRLLAARLADIDHTFFNIVATPGGNAARLDLELAVVKRWRPLSEEFLGRMLGRLIGTLAYGCSGHGELVRRFALRLEERVGPGPRARAIAQRQIERMLEKERRAYGLDVQLDLDWD